MASPLDALHMKASDAFKIQVFMKWLRYYLDYCCKYNFSVLSQSSLPNFTNKLQEKNQKPFQQKQANTAIHIFYELAEQNLCIKTSLSSNNKQGQNKGYNTTTTDSKKSFQKDEESTNIKKSNASCGNTNKNKQKWQNFYQKLSDDLYAYGEIQDHQRIKEPVGY